MCVHLINTDSYFLISTIRFLYNVIDAIYVNIITQTLINKYKIN